MMTDDVRERQREVHDMYLDAAEIEVSTEGFDVERSKAFNFHSV